MANPKRQMGALFFAGLLPVIAFTLIEEYYGIIAGLIAGMVFGVGEITYELIRYKKVQKITWIGNGLLLVLGGISLISSEGIWFKLQPAFMEAALVVAMWGSLLIKKPLLVVLAEQQGHKFPEPIRTKMSGVTFRVGLFFLAHTGLAIWAAFAWSTTAWALLKGVGLTVSFVVYLILEVIYLRKSLSPQALQKIQADLAAAQAQNQGTKI